MAICAGLVAANIVQAIGAIVLSVSASQLLVGGDDLYGFPVPLVFTAAVLSVFGLFVLQNRYAEHFALTYVHDIRLAYARQVFLLPFDQKAPGVGLSLTRLVNDLGAIKLWVSKGLLSLIALIPILGTIGLWIAIIQPALFWPMIAVIATWSLCVVLCLPGLRHTIQKSRQKRGSLAVLLGETLPARLPLLLHGRLEPVLNRLARRSLEVTGYLTGRATWSGVLKASSRATFPAAVIVFAVTSSANADDLVLFLMIFSFLAAQLETAAAGIEYNEANKVGREKLNKVFALSAMQPLTSADHENPEWAKPLCISGLKLPSGRTISATLEAGASQEIALPDPMDRHYLALALAGLTQAAPSGCIQLGCTDYTSIGRKTVWSRVALISQLNGIPTLRGNRPAVELGNKKNSALEWLPALEELLPERADCDHSNAAKLCDGDQLNIRIVRALLRNPKLLVVHDSGLRKSSLLGEKLQRLAKNAGITVLFISAEASDPA